LQTLRLREFSTCCFLVSQLLEARGMANPVQVPAWLLRRLFLKSGAFNEERTVVISGPQGQPTGTGTFSIDLTRRSDWQEIQRTLAQEGFLEARAG